MGRFSSFFSVGLALAALVACADDGPWQKPNVSPDDMARDQAACRRLATTEAERDLVLNDERATSARGNSRTGAYMAQMNRFSAGKDRDDLFERCMARSGYTRGPGSDPQSKFEALSAPGAEPQAEPHPDSH